MRTKRVIRVGVLVGLVVLSAGAGGCSTMNNTEKGVGLGAAAGSGVGLGVGALTGNPKTGAVVGGLLGAGLGGAIGNDMDRQDQRRRDVVQAQAQAQANAQVQARRMGMTDVVEMVQKGHDEQVIINQIRTTGSTFQLSAADLDFLKSYNVPPRVILEMQTAKPAAAPTRVIVREPAPQTVIVQEPGPPVYVVPGPPPPRPVYVVGGVYHRHW
jgi:hypothetical protein